MSSASKTSTSTDLRWDYNECFDVAILYKYLPVPQIMSLQFKILIDDKIIGEVSKDVSKIDKGTDFSEPVSLVLHVSPATEKVRFHIDHVSIISPEIFVRYSTLGTFMYVQEVTKLSRSSSWNIMIF